MRKSRAALFYYFPIFYQTMNDSPGEIRYNVAWTGRSVRNRYPAKPVTYLKRRGGTRPPPKRFRIYSTEEAERLYG